MSSPKALLASPHHWTSPFQVGGHQFARAFANEGWQVGYISNPISPLHLLGGDRRTLGERLRIYRHGGVRDLGGRIWATVPAALLTPNRAFLLRSRWVHRNWHRLTLPSITGQVGRHGFDDVDVLYLDSVVQGFWLDAIEHRRSVLRIGDSMAGFPQFTREMHRLQRDIATRVNLVVYTASGLEEEVRLLGPRAAMHLPNGVDFAHFSAESPPPADLTDVPSPIAIYVGAMDDWFNFALVDRLTARLPDVSFVLVGPDTMARRRLTARPNLHLLGPRPYALLPALLQRADIGLIPFDVIGHGDLVHNVHPLKLYEYMAAGLPVVATRWRELERLGSPATLCDGTDDFVEAIRAALAGPIDRDRLVTFAERASWSSRLRQLLEGLQV